jgi:anti-sigma factor RsiW
MNCEQVQELLDAYALGAAEREEASAIEAHVADCLRCWTVLNEAQRAAAAIALSAAGERVPRSLRARVLAEAAATRPGAGSPASLLRRLMPAAAALATAGAAATLAFAFVLQAEVNDLNSDKDALEAEVQAADARLDQQQETMAVLVSPDAQTVSLEAVEPGLNATATYHWSASGEKGVLVCDGLRDLDEGEVYKVWLVTDEGNHELADFRAWRDGGYQASMSTAGIEEAPVGIGVSVEAQDGATEPSAMILWADLRR